MLGGREDDIVIEIRKGLAEIRDKTESNSVQIEGFKVRLETLSERLNKLAVLIEGNSREGLLAAITRMNVELENLNEKVREIAQTNAEREIVMLRNRGLIATSIVGGILGLISAIATALLNLLRKSS